MSSRAMLYDRIGVTYAKTRVEDPRFAAAIGAALGVWETLINVGAGTGNYEPQRDGVVAVEPSTRMIAQRRSLAPVIQAVAEALPFPPQAFDVAMALSTVHHWSDPERGLRELQRISRLQVVLYFEPLAHHGFWPFDYFTDPPSAGPPHDRLVHEVLHIIDVRELLVPTDCSDGCGAAYWARPEQYLDPDIQAGMSWIAKMSPAERARGMARLAADLASGEWERRYGHLRQLDAYDAGYRIAIAGTPA